MGTRFRRMAENPGQTLVTRFELKTKDGGTKPVEAAAAVIRDGEFTGVHGSARDVSDQERLERSCASPRPATGTSWSPRRTSCG
ncbi:MAG: PAS domain S-box protein [Chloroflexota bacterium]